MSYFEIVELDYNGKKYSASIEQQNGTVIITAMPEQGELISNHSH